MEHKKLDITGVLLVGGESRRMGRNKAFLEIAGKPLLERNLEVMGSICNEVIISCRETDQYEGYTKQYQVIADRIKNKGPLAGLCSILPLAKYEYIFMAACDMPLLNRQAIAYIYSQIEDYQLIYPYVWDRLHPLHAFYHQSILPVAEKHLQEDQLSLLDLPKGCRTKTPRVSELLAGNPTRELIEQSFLNVNTPLEWDRINEKLMREVSRNEKN